MLRLNIVRKETEIGHHLKVVHLVFFAGLHLAIEHEFHEYLLSLLELFGVEGVLVHQAHNARTNNPLTHHILTQLQQLLKHHQCLLIQRVLQVLSQISQQPKEELLHF